jgi:hypothetical protein
VDRITLEKAQDITRLCKNFTGSPYIRVFLQQMGTVGSERSQQKPNGHRVFLSF